MSKYKFRTDKTDDYNSEYESDGGTEYKAHKFLGKGTYSRVYAFIAPNKKQKAILKPLSIEEIYNCCLIKLSYDPRHVPFKEIVPLLQGKNAAVLFENNLYYVHYQTKSIEKIAAYDQDKYNQLKSLFKDGYTSVEKNERRLIAVLTNRDWVDDNEIRTKYEFFKTLYPQEHIELIEQEGTFRLVTPFIPGESYPTQVSDTEQHINLFISAIKALQDCHDKGYVVVDLKRDNIHYDEANNKSYLIDGGISAKEGQPVNPNIFIKEDNYKVTLAQSTYFYIAPECWSTSEVLADRRMDIYSLGVMMKRILITPEPGILKLIQQCQNSEPSKRPTLSELEKKLSAMQTTTHSIAPTAGFFAEKSRPSDDLKSEPMKSFN